ncbi:VOC family protein [Ornithinimicrobium humiphilum]|uniref:Glyoxalase-like protein n=1 Tax=Ornithinimicrobium humiphilum TaxID=125288 RepID=A0A543KN79_9MICO|nr:VOC family protein [Ornithinimicrobium humiphilum]TQM96526.1 glyoxalase-like protein [Ornithinimicrobium humiphilum]
MTAELDHLVLAVPDLEAAIADLAARTGVEPVAGGSHPGRGTHNALVGLRWRGGARCYLELLAPDPAQQDVPDDAWMLDVGSLGHDFAPRLHTWAVRPDDLDARVAAATREGIEAGRPVAASRRTISGEQLSWRLAVPRPLGLGGVQPFLIDWGGGPHPADTLAPQLELVELELSYPDPTEAQARLSALGVDLPVFAAEQPGLRATLATPRGTVVLA